MIRISITGNIGSGKTFISKLFGYPVFSADKIVSKLYSENKTIYSKLKKRLPKFFSTFPVKKEELISAILSNKKNIKKISLIVHPEVRKKLKIFLNNNKNKKVVILDIPLYFENKLNKKEDIIIFVSSDQKQVLKRIKKRKYFNRLIFQRLKALQFSSSYKRMKSNYIIRNNFNKKLARKKVKDILKKVLS